MYLRALATALLSPANSSYCWTSGDQTHSRQTTRYLMFGSLKAILDPTALFEEMYTEALFHSHGVFLKDSV